MARYSVFSGPPKHSGNMFKSEVTSNLASANLTKTCFYFH